MEKINNILNALSRRYYGRDLKVKKNTTGALRYLLLVFICMFISYNASGGIQILFFYKHFIYRLFFGVPIFFVLLKIFNDFTGKLNFLSRQYKVFIFLIFYFLVLVNALYIYCRFLYLDQMSLSTSDFINLILNLDFKQNLPVVYATIASVFILSLSFIGLIITKNTDLDLIEKEIQNEELFEKNRNDAEFYLFQYRKKEIESVNSQILIFTNINHELGNKLPQMKIDVDTLHEYLKSKESDSINLLNEPVQIPLSIEDSSSIEKVQELITRMDNTLRYSIGVINSMGMIIKLGPNNLKKEFLNLNKFLTSEIETFPFDRNLIQIEVRCDRELFANFDQFQFRILISNFIENAIRHGRFQFGNTNFILFNVYEKDENIIFEIINNGRSVDKEFTIKDFVKPNSFFGETGNTGFGGYIIGMILTNHAGFVELIDMSNENIDYKVCFKISIPKN